MVLSIDNIKIERNLNCKTVRTQAAVQALAATTIIFDAASEFKWIFTGNVAGQVILLSVATSILVGHVYEIQNNGTQAITLKDAASTTLFIIKAGYRLTATLQVNSTVAGTWSIAITANVEAITQIMQIGTTSYFNDFLFDAFHAHSLVLSTVVGGGTGVINDGTNLTNTSSGIVIMGTGTTNSNAGKSMTYSNAGLDILAGGQTLEWRIKLPVLSTTTPRYDFKAGAADNLIKGDPANGIYFQYSDNVNGGCWVGITRNASTSTTVNSTILVVANVWVRLRAVINVAGTLVEFYVDDVYIGSSNLNIPTTNPTRFQASIEKISVSTTTRLAILDWYQYSVLR